MWTFLSQVIQHMTDDLLHFSDVAAGIEEEEAMAESAREEAWTGAEAAYEEGGQLTPLFFKKYCFVLSKIFVDPTKK